MKKYAVITFLFGKDYEILREIPQNALDTSIEYICFTNILDLKSDTWKIKYIKFTSHKKSKWSNRQQYYYMKYNFIDYIPTDIDYILRIDASIQIKNNPISYLQYFDNTNKLLGISLHSIRNNNIDEYNTWIKIRKLNPYYKENYIYTCNKLNFDINTTGCIETTCLFLKNNNKVKEILHKTIDNILRYQENKDDVEQIWFTFTILKYYPNNDDYIFFYKRSAYIGNNILQMCYHGNNVEILEPFLYIVNNENDLYMQFNNKLVKTVVLKNEISE